MEGQHKRKRHPHPHQVADGNNNNNNKEEDLPRGGGSGLTPLELRKIHQQADSDFLFEMKSKEGKKTKGKGGSAGGKKKPKKKSSKSAAEEVEEEAEEHQSALDRELSGSITSLNVPKRAHLLSPTVLTVGMVLLGAVRKIGELKMTLGLPNNLSGVVSMPEVTDTLRKLLKKRLKPKADDNEEEEEESQEDLPKMSDFFQLGQLLPCAITRLEKKSNGKLVYALSLRPSLVNKGLSIQSLTPGMAIYGSIKSVEDHGYLVSFGLNEYSGFLLKKNIADQTEDGDEMKIEEEKKRFVVGQPVYCLVESVNSENNTVSLRYDPAQYAQAVTRDENVFTLSTLKAGMLVEAQVKKVLANGLFLTFLGYFGGTVDINHTGFPLSHYKEGKKVKARVLYVDYNKKRTGLSLLPHVVEMRPFPFAENTNTGDIHGQAVITRIEENVGMLLKLPTDPSQDAFVHVSRVSDEKGSFKLNKKFELGEAVSCRILSRDYVDGIVHVSMAKSVLEMPFLRVQDIQVGTKVKGKVLSLTPKGMLISLTKSIKAFCPTVHLSDVELQDPSTRFKPDMAIKCRVLGVDLENERVTVTCKKTLVSSDLPIIQSFEDAVPGLQTLGVVSSIQNYGVFVTFYNLVTGLAALDQLSNAYVPDPNVVYRVGQVVKCRVLSCDPKAKRIQLTFLIQKKDAEEQTRLEYAFQEVKCGDLVSGKVRYQIEGGIKVIVDGGINGVITLPNLSDHPSHVDPIKATFQRDAIIKDMLILEKREAQQELVLSIKPSLVEAAKEGKLQVTKEDIKPGMILMGVLSSITNFGCFVTFPGGISGLAYLTNLVDGPLDDPKKRFTPGQTVRAYVLDASEKITLSLKPSRCAGSASISFMQSYFKEEEVLAEANPEGGPPKPKMNWSAFNIGSAVEATVKIIKDFGVVLAFDDPKVTGLVVSEQITAKEDVKEGDRVKVVILDVDRQRCIVDASMRQELVSNALPPPATNSKKSRRRKSKQPHEKLEAMEEEKIGGLKNEDPVDCTVELVKGSYLVVSLAASDEQQGVRIGFIPTKDFNTQNLDPFSSYTILQNCRAIIKQLPTTTNDRLLLLLANASKKTAAEQVKLTEVNAISDLNSGTVVNAKVARVSALELQVSLGPHVKARIPITEIIDNLAQLEGETNLLKRFKVGDEFEAKVLRLRNAAKRGQILPISHQNTNAVQAVELTIRPSDMDQPTLQIQCHDKWHL